MVELNCQTCQKPIIHVNTDGTITRYSHAAPCSGVLSGKAVMKALVETARRLAALGEMIENGDKFMTENCRHTETVRVGKSNIIRCTRCNSYFYREQVKVSTVETKAFLRNENENKEFEK